MSKITIYGEDIVSCDCDPKEICDLEAVESEECPRCARYAALLRTVREMYGDTRWAVTPEGVLQELG